MHNNATKKDIYKEIQRGFLFQLEPFQLVSLWEMITISLGRVSAVASLLTEFESKLQAVLNIAKKQMPAADLGGIRMSDLNPQRDPVNSDILRTLLEQTKSVADEIGVISTQMFIQIIVDDLDRTTLGNLQSDLKKLQKMFEKEVSEETVMCIPKVYALWFNNDISFGESVKNAFPSALDDIREAGNCYALDRPTACVFHSMRILEYGLSALAKEVGLEFNTQNWHNIIKKIESVIEKEAESIKTPERDEHLQFLSEAAKEFMYFKDGWRNHVSHKRVIYDTHQALSVISHVRSFMIHLSTQLKE